jgi:hypothetical protein
VHAAQLHAPRAVAAALAAFVLALAIALLLPSAIGGLELRSTDRTAPTTTTTTPAPTWHTDPLASPIDGLREVPR